MKTSRKSNKFRTSLAGALAFSIAISPLANVAHAAATSVSLADAPLQSLNPIKPNLMYILDNSGSMAWNTVTGYDGLNEYDGSGTTRAYYSSDYNHVWYNPAITYQPPVNYYGGPQFTDGTYTQTSPSGLAGSSKPTNALVDPYLSPTGTTTNLTQTCYSSGSSPLTAPLPVGKNDTSGNCRNPANLISGYVTKVARYAFYYKWNGSTNISTSSPSDSAFNSRVDITSTGLTLTDALPDVRFPRASKRTDCVADLLGLLCSYNEEIANFANWHSYYSSRLLMAKSSIGRAFLAVDANPTLDTTLPTKTRVGFTTINNSSYDNTDVTDSAYWLTIRDFSSTSPATSTSQKALWYSKLYATTAANGTPLRRQLDKIGRMYEKTLTGAADPVQYACQKNFAILQTDGYWNAGEVAPAGIGDQDSNASDGYSTRASGSLDANAQSNTLADVAMYYYKTDLRTTALGNCTGAAGVDVCDNTKIKTSSSDPVPQQHMATYTIGLGANGQKPYRSDYATATSGFFYNLTQGSDNWPTPVGDTATAIDDLWHAAVNGRGSYLNAGDPQTLTDGLTEILKSINGQAASGAGTAVSSPNIVAPSNIAYSVGYDPNGWSGDMAAWTIDATTGQTTGTPLWHANTNLDGQNWDSGRKIVTKNLSASGGVPFRWANSSPWTQANFGTTATAQQKLINYLRGDKTNEVPATGAIFRRRVHLLGDIGDSEAVVVSAPVAPYYDQNNKGYGQFKTTQASRASTIYFGANDGMLHAFDATTGLEKWAYVPGILMDSTRNAATSLASLSYQPAPAVPSFTHHYFVDATPVVTDVDFATTGGATCSTATCDWHTILVGGLGKGGKGFYALDVTTPPTASDTESTIAASKVLWEFNDGSSADMGYSYGKPLIVKTTLYGWVVIVSSGYNNTSGRSVVYVLNAKTGAKLFQFNVPAGTNNGLAQLAAYTLDISDYTVQQVYGGDLDGNVWRFDMNPSLTSWSSAPTLFAQLRDVNGNVQPVTTQPEIESDPRNDTDRWVFLGTGKLLDITDLTTATGYNDSMYAMKDGTKYQTEPTAHGFSLPVTRAKLVTQTPGSTTGITLPSLSSGKDGWLMDFTAGSGERVNVDPVAIGGAVAWVTNKPTNDPCTQGMAGAAYVRDYSTANTLIKDASGTALPKVSSDTAGFVKIQVVKIKGTVRIIATTDDSITNTSTGGTALGSKSALGMTVCSGNCTPTLGKVIRTNWREIPQ